VSVALDFTARTCEVHVRAALGFSTRIPST
jgi:hypothetical protein